MVDKNFQLTQSERVEHIFPTLTAAQIARFAAHGRTREVQAGEVLAEQGDLNYSFYLVISGQIEIISPRAHGDEVIATHGAGQFFGDVGMLSSRRSLVRARMREAGQVIELDRASLRELIAIDSELSDILMRAFILR